MPQLADAEEVLRRLDRHPGARYLVLVPNQRGLQRALDLGVTDIAVFASATESFAKTNLNRTVAESLAMFTVANTYRDWPRWRSWCQQTEHRMNLTPSSPGPAAMPPAEPGSTAPSGQGTT